MTRAQRSARISTRSSATTTRIVEFEITNNRPDCYQSYSAWPARRPAAFTRSACSHHEPVVKGGAEGCLHLTFSMSRSPADDLCLPVHGPHGEKRQNCAQSQVDAAAPSRRQASARSTISSTSRTMSCSSMASPCMRSTTAMSPAARSSYAAPGADETLTTLDGKRPQPPARYARHRRRDISPSAWPVSWAARTAEIVSDTVARGLRVCKLPRKLPIRKTAHGAWHAHGRLREI